MRSRRSRCPLVVRAPPRRRAQRSTSARTSLEPRPVVHVDVRDLVIGDGERRARPGIEHLAGRAPRRTAIRPRSRSARLMCTGRDTSHEAVLRQHDDPRAARFVELDQIAGDVVDLRAGRPAARERIGTEPLQVVVEMRQVDERQRRDVLLARRAWPLRRSSASR